MHVLPPEWPRGKTEKMKFDSLGLAAPISAAVASAGGAWAALHASPVSARTGEGIADLRARILSASPFGGVTWFRQAAPFLPRQRDALLEIQARLRSKVTS